MPDSILSEAAQYSFNASEELGNLLYRYAPATLLTAQFIAVVIIFALYNYVDQAELYLWLSAITLFNMLRLGLVYAKTRTKAERPSFVWIHRYVFVTLFAGVSWAMLLYFLHIALPFYAQLLIIMTLACMPVASMPNNAIYLPVYYAFTVPNLIGLLYWAGFIVDKFKLEYTVLALAYAAVLLITAHNYHGNLRQALKERTRNEKLAEALWRANKQLEEFAYVDPLTGLTNRRWFQEQADIALERCQRHGTALALILIDLDNFKQINDQLGHTAGDEVLKAIGKRLKATFRQTDSIAHAQTDAARFGGDEFIVLLEDIKSTADVDKAARRVIKEIRDPLRIEASTLRPSCSMGIALYPDNGHTIATLIRRADVALYRVKDSGRNSFQFYDHMAVGSTL